MVAHPSGVPRSRISPERLHPGMTAVLHLQEIRETNIHIRLLRKAWTDQKHVYQLPSAPETYGPQPFPVKRGGQIAQRRFRHGHGPAVWSVVEITHAHNILLALGTEGITY